jgi:CubicO group peptidase (beta-lactamase class C family)
MARWAYELYSVNGSAISFVSRKNLLKSLSSRPVLYQGIKQPYGYFATKRIYTFPRSINLVTYGHPGGGGGYSSLLRYAPELDLSVSVLANSLLQFGSSCPKLDIRHCIASRIFSAYGSHTSSTTGTSNVKKVSDHSVKEPGSDR